MALHGYGLLVGKIVGFRKPEGHKPHWLLMVQPGNPHHPPYRVAVNVPATQPGDFSEIEYQVLDLTRHPLVRQLRKYKVRGGTVGTHAFLLADEIADVPRLSYESGKILDPAKFPSERAREPKVEVPHGPQPLASLHAALQAAAEANELVAVFGTGFPMDHRSGSFPSTGFTGVDNVHMNQGAFNRTNGTLHYLENGRAQDGGLIVLPPTRAVGIFIKFRSQSIHTAADGQPLITGVKEIDEVSPRVRKKLMPTLPRKLREYPASRRGRTLSAAAVRSSADEGPGIANDLGFVFADFNPGDASGEYIPDEDANTYQSPIVVAQSKGHTRGPVPKPRQNPLMDLASVVGANPPGYLDSGGTQTLAFDIVGDSGAPSQAKLEGYEMKVADLMTQDAATSAPAFMYHVGDVVYFYGERAYYYSQFYEPFRAYPAPIFAIPGNHDGVIYEASQISLADFQSAFCAQQPGRWAGSGGILRSAMTQPGVFFTLNHPLVSIIGLYSNCGESLGWLDDQQLTFLYNELTRLKGLKRNGLPAVIMAIHHFPRWFPGQAKADPYSTAIDAVYKQAAFWPDAVICGHAHLYQRVIRQNVGTRGNQDVPYIMSGAGGYGISPSEQVGKPYMQKLGVAPGRSSALGCIVNESGYVRATVTSPRAGNPTLEFEYRSVKPSSSGPDDKSVLDLVARRIVS